MIIATLNNIEQLSVFSLNIQQRHHQWWILAKQTAHNHPSRELVRLHLTRYLSFCNYLVDIEHFTPVYNSTEIVRKLENNWLQTGYIPRQK